MQINVTFRNIEPSLPLRKYAEDKLSRVKKYLDEPIEAHLVLKVEKFRHIAEVSIEANGLRINGAEQTDDLYSALDMLADTVEGLAKKGKEKTRRRKPTNTAKDFAVSPDSSLYESADEEKEQRVIRTEQIYAKPMDLEEAVMQLNLSNGEFMVFTNRHSNRINVLYRRKDGHYGLIETIA
jgi:putative sigma-54 modulation protein